MSFNYLWICIRALIVKGPEAMLKLKRPLE